MKTLEQNFADWEISAFGFGYGTGEPHIMPVLKTFFSLCPSPDSDYRCYDYEELERKLTPAVAWLLINVLGHQDIIEYGMSPRYAWLTDKGYALKAFVDSHTADQLIEIVCTRGETELHCYPDVCNCSPEELDGAERCSNPFWGHVTVPQ